MPKVRIILEAEIGDLKGYWPNKPKGVTQQNIGDFLAELKLLPLERITSTMAKEDEIKCEEGGKEKFDYLISSYKEDAELGKRLLTKYSVEIIEEKENERLKRSASQSQ